jgi:hypothetical protein
MKRRGEIETRFRQESDELEIGYKEALVRLTSTYQRLSAALTAQSVTTGASKFTDLAVGVESELSEKQRGR